MREQLKHLEGQLVVLQGRVAKARITDDHRYFFCVSRPILTSWDGNQPLLSGEKSAKADHVWVATKDDCNWPTLYQKHVMVGRCGYYRRKNGSVDLTVTNVAKSINGEKYYWEIKAVLQSKKPETDRIDQAKRYINDLAGALLSHGNTVDGQEVYVFTKNFTVLELTEKVVALHREVMKRQQQLTLQSLHHLKPVAQQPGSMLFLNQPTAPKHQTALETLLRGNNV